MKMCLRVKDILYLKLDCECIEEKIYRQIKRLTRKEKGNHRKSVSCPSSDSPQKKPEI